MKTYLEAGRVFCWIGNQAQINKENTSWVSYGAITPENEAKGALPVNQSAGTGWIQTFVSKSCEEPEKVAEFLSWITSEEGLMMDYYGIEGDYYTVDDKGIVTKTEKGEQELSGSVRAIISYSGHLPILLLSVIPSQFRIQQVTVVLRLH